MPSSVRRSFPLVLAAAFAAIGAGCLDLTAPGSISGSWITSCTGDSGACIEMYLSESGGTLSGNAGTGFRSYSATGTYDRPHVTIVLVPAGSVIVNDTTGFTTIVYEGTASGGTMTLRTVGPNPETVIYKRGSMVLPTALTALAR